MQVVIWGFHAIISPYTLKYTTGGNKNIILYIISGRNIECLSILLLLQTSLSNPELNITPCMRTDLILTAQINHSRDTGQLLHSDTSSACWPTERVLDFNYGTATLMFRADQGDWQVWFAVNFQLAWCRWSSYCRLNLQRVSKVLTISSDVTLVTSKLSQKKYKDRVNNNMVGMRFEASFQLPVSLALLLYISNSLKVEIAPRRTTACSEWSAVLMLVALVGALELWGCTGWIKLCFILMYYTNLTAVFP